LKVASAKSPPINDMCKFFICGFLFCFINILIILKVSNYFLIIFDNSALISPISLNLKSFPNLLPSFFTVIAFLLNIT